jgi:hypothetical protein
VSPLASRPSKYSQSGRILKVLEWAWEDGFISHPGGWVSATEIFRNLPAGATIHSRVSELRKTWGFDVQHETRGLGAAGSFYRLVLPEAGSELRDSVNGRVASAGPGAQLPASGSIGAAAGASESATDSPLPAGRSEPQPASPQLSLPLSGRLREVA